MLSVYVVAPSTAGCRRLPQVSSQALAGLFTSISRSLYMRRRSPLAAAVCRRSLCMLTYAHVCSRMLTYAYVCSRMLTYAHVCSRMLTVLHSLHARLEASQRLHSGRWEGAYHQQGHDGAGGESLKKSLKRALK
jgi:hypothetical protein